MFVLTESDISANEIQSCVAAGCSILACSSILLTSAWVYSVPSASNMLDRVSFRLLLHALCFEIIYDISYIVVVAPGVNGRLANGVCVTGVYFMMAGIGVVNYHITFIAVNLAATIVFGLNPLRLRLEQWYWYTSMFVGFFVPIIPAALGHFGWDPVLDVCWIKAGNDRDRMRNLVLDLYLWQLLSCLIATVAVIMTLVTLFRQGRATSRALFSGDSLNLTMSGEETLTDSSGNGVPPPRIGGPIGRIMHRRRLSRHRRHAFGHLEDRFVRIAVRIAAYPVCLAIVNGVIAIGDLYLSATGGVKTRAEFGLYIVYYFFYGARGCVFAFICIFVDPCLRNGVREAWAVKFPKQDSHEQSISGPGLKGIPMFNDPGYRPPFVTLNEPSPPTADPTGTAVETRGGEGTAGGQMDFMQALFDLDADYPEDHDDKEKPRTDDEQMDARRSSKWSFWKQPKVGKKPSPLPPSSPKSRPPSPESERPVMPKPQSFSNQFTGVPLDALPHGLNDAADDIVQAEVLEQSRAVEAMERMLAEPSPSISEGSPRGFVERLKAVDKLQRRLDRVSPSHSPSGDLSPAPSRAHSPRPVRTFSRDDGKSSKSVASRSRQQSHGDRRRPSMVGRSSTARRPSGVRTPRTIEQERRERRDRAQELAERLYDELQAQL